MENLLNQNLIDMISSIYVFIFVLQMILFGFEYHRMLSKSIVKTITSVHGIFFMASMLAFVFDGVKNPYIITMIVSFIGFIIGIANDRE